MKSIVFTEEQLADLQAVGKALFEDAQDPRSVAYIRKLERPRINWLFVAGYFVLFGLLIAGVILCAGRFQLSLLWTLAAVAGMIVVYTVLTAKRAAICAVKIYQRFAPAALRNKCRFEPSCSEYMILSIEKYGLLKGIKKGTNRLKRCNISDGGIDYP